MKTDSKGKVCPFCIENRLVEILDETQGAFLVQAVKSVDGVSVPQMGRYLVIPKAHLKSFNDRSKLWTVHESFLVKSAFKYAERDDELMSKVVDADLSQSLNLSWNNGSWAGQTIEHLHLWVIFRYDNMPIGMDAMISELTRRSSVPQIDAAPKAWQYE